MLFFTKTVLTVVAVLARATNSAADLVDDALTSRSISCGDFCPENMVCDSHSIPGFPEVLSPGCTVANKKWQDSCGGCREGFVCDNYAIGFSSPMCVPSSVKRQVDVAREMCQLRAVAEDGQECVAVAVPGGPAIGLGLIVEHRCRAPEDELFRKRQLRAITADVRKRQMTHVGPGVEADAEMCGGCAEGQKCIGRWPFTPGVPMGLPTYDYNYEG
ncbi:uncharacterized protein J7T54_000928 [Emericellopsis cladophorae]|uniref:Uncharacterized protein n=1 Tax=Emericellopsis cladophorae TaxID=2686198 RepID=A0A9P9Y3R6_9HYPO|nr:uncharacterized protein J7T54_000928 [Emericellopsis cladophorae]KAI6782785.1 hypothetical protein J7T54_000928 [Emericellopsis cladophorae]